MKKTIDFTSRTVWTGLTMAIIGLVAAVFPEIVPGIDAAPETLIGTGLGLVFLKS